MPIHAIIKNACLLHSWYRYYIDTFQPYVAVPGRYTATDFVVQEGLYLKYVCTNS
jgi:hypothetical protein